jgi:Zn-dependent protease with chaperone function
MTRPAAVLALAAGLLLTAAARGAEPLPPGVPEPTPAAVAYHHTGNALWLLARAWTLAVPAWFLATGASAALRTRLERNGRKAPSVALLFVAAYALIDRLLLLPLSFYAGFLRPHDYGLSTESSASWARDELLALGLDLALLVPLGVGAMALIRRFPRRWWLIVAALAPPLALGYALARPLVVDPLFNDFRPLDDPALERRILDLAHRCGVDADRVHVADMSRRTRAVNAYVTGLLGSHRVVLWDTLLQRLGPDEVAVVMAHELGHFRLGHVATGVLAGSALAALGLGLVHLAATTIIARAGPRLGLRSLADPAALPLLVLLGQLAYVALAPAGYAFSRRIEHEADRFALELTRDNDAAARAFLALQRENLGYPRPAPAVVWLRATHPPLADRVAFARHYRPWDTGDPLRYGELFATPRELHDHRADLTPPTGRSSPPTPPGTAAD